MNEVRLKELGNGSFTVHYPVSGARLKLTGRLVLFDESLDWTPGLMHGKELHMLDPRCLIVGDGGRVYFNPRQQPLNQSPPWVAQWLAENPHWPPID